MLSANAFWSPAAEERLLEGIWFNA